MTENQLKLVRLLVICQMVLIALGVVMAIGLAANGMKPESAFWYGATVAFAPEIAILVALWLLP